MTTWLAINSAAILIVSFIVYLVIRQIGFLLNRVGPSGARTTDEGPRVGENLDRFISKYLSLPLCGRDIQLLIFGSHSCSICSTVKVGAERLSEVWNRKANILIIYDKSRTTGHEKFERLKSGFYFLETDAAARRGLNISFVPFALVADGEGKVLRKALVNEIGHIESLLEFADQEIRKSNKNNRQGTLESKITAEA